MRIALLVVAGLASLVLAVAVVLPQRAGAEAREAAQALILGAEPAKQQQVAAYAEKSGNLVGVELTRLPRRAIRSTAR